jgi:hypothetical protein
MRRGRVLPGIPSIGPTNRIQSKEHHHRNTIDTVLLIVLLNLRTESGHFTNHFLEPIKRMLLQIQPQPAISAHSFHVIRLDTRVHVVQRVESSVREATSGEEEMAKASWKCMSASA